MDFPHKIPPSGTPVTHHRHTEVVTQDQAQGTIGKTGREGTTLDHILHTADITVPVVVTCTEAAPGHHTRTGITAIEVAQDSLTQHTGDIATYPTMTHHSGHTAHITVIQTTTLETAEEHIAAHQATTLKTTVDPAHDHPTTHQSTGHTRRDHTTQYHIPTSETARPTQEGA